MKLGWRYDVGVVGITEEETWCRYGQGMKFSKKLKNDNF